MKTSSITRQPPLPVDERATVEEAVAAWRSCDSAHRSPTAITTLKEAARKSAVYRLAGAGPVGEDIVGKRCLTATAQLEYAVYTVILPRTSLRHLRCHGLVAAGDGVSWLFIEDAGGAPFRGGDPSHRALAARWMATLHSSAGVANLEFLPDRGIGYQRRRLDAATQSLRAAEHNDVLNRDDKSTVARALDGCASLANRWDDVIELCAHLPETLLHGDFGRKNVHVRDRAGGLELLLFDWETAGHGPPAIDLARVDPDVYAREVSQAFPAITTRIATHLSKLGAALWCVSSIPGEAEALASPWASRVIGKLDSYAEEMDSALSDLGWKGGAGGN